MKLGNSKKLKVGIPRGLFYYRDFPFWKTFFENLGAEVLVSPKTNAQILKEGIAHLTGDVCLPVKAFCGHCLSLVKKCDFLFVPSIYSLEKRVYNCAKFIGLPDLMKSVIKNSIEILDPDINLEKGKENFYQNLEKIGQNFTDSSQKIKIAVEKAEKNQKTFENNLWQEKVNLAQVLAGPSSFCRREQKKEAKEDCLTTIGLVGHPYLIYDAYLNHGLIEKLEGLRIKVLFPEQVSKEEQRKALLKLVDRPYWTCEDEIIGAGVYFLERKEVSGLICLSAFGCGPDSLMVDFLRRYAREIGKIFLNLSLDEHTAEAGLVTRLEAFADSLNPTKKHYPLPAPIGQVKEEKIGTLGIPNMGEKFSIFKEAFQKEFGVNLLTPPVTQKTITLGAKYAPQDSCLPFKATLGNLIECLEQGADTLVMVTSFNACRMGYYLKVQEKILQDLGFQFRFLKLHSKDRGIRGGLALIKKLTNNASWLKILRFSFLAVAKLRVLDEIEREVQKIRPREIEKGQADKTYREAFEAIAEVKNIFRLRKVRKEYLKKLKEIKKDEKVKPLKIGIVGELYVVAEPFVNMDLEKELGKRGVLVERPKSTFFSEYTKPFYFNPLGEEKKRLKKFTKFYLKRDVGGHGLESLGLKIEYARRKWDGIIHLMPFTCLPETIAQNIMLSTKEKIPVLTIACDEQTSRAGLITRIEAFIDLLKTNSKRSE